MWEPFLYPTRAVEDSQRADSWLEEYVLVVEKIVVILVILEYL